MLSKEERALYAENNLPLPTSFEHGTVEEIDAKRGKRINHVWFKQEAQYIFCKCDIGLHSSTIPMDVLLIGSEDGKPIFKKINVV